MRKTSSPGSEAARDKWLLQKNIDFLEKVLPQAGKLPGTSGLFKQIVLGKKVLPQAAKLPRTSDFFQKKRLKVLPQAATLPGTSGFFQKSLKFEKKSAPGSEAARDKWLVQKQVSF